MVEIIKTYQEAVKPMRFIGKKYGNEDRVNGFFGAKWDEWFENGWFSQLEKLNPYEGWHHYIGLMGHEEGEFKYWVGMFLPADTVVPEGFDHMDYPGCRIAACRLKGHEDHMYGNEPMCSDRLIEEGYEMLEREFICFERELDCDDPETTSLKEKEGIIDICFFVKSE